MKKESLQKAALWDKRYEKTDATDLPGPAPDPRLITLKHSIRNMLDIGCGTGEIVHAWGKKKVHATGLDISGNAISLAKRNTPAAIYPYCRWVVDDWDTLDLKEYRWEHAFDLVYSCMGPDFTQENNFKKLNLISRKYIRLLLFKSGVNSILEKLEKEMQITLPESPPSGLVAICKQLESAHYNPEITDISYEENYSQSLERWKLYVASIFPEPIDEKSTEEYLLSLSVNGSISSTTKVTYSMITWEI